LLLSYPCCEAYMISSFEKNKYYKRLFKANSYKLFSLDRYKIKRAVLEMLKALEKLGINDFDIDHIGIRY